MNDRTIQASIICVALALTAPAWGQKGMTTIGDDPATPTESSPANADPNKEIRPPAPAEPEKAAVAVPYLLTFVLAGAAVALAVFPSGRTHQD